MSQSTDPMRRAAERLHITVPPIDPDPDTTLIQLTRGADIACRHRPYPQEVARGLAEDHPPRLDITAGPVRVRLEIDPAMTSHQVRRLISHLRPEVRAWLDQVAEYAHDLEMSEASQDQDGGDRG
ncbi:hypothetical protein FZ103_00105 [Streptomonospora sp. PA3]|uniref:hypothetical protein n=1 Tax=Streptomonospora sp. PA3 TaxID=2607326 RepID=UPI0012DF770C|nr:hypothetical protein [Streptomonospora sp. PA3]MUL39596.1 hypothetical protein [Streptomonospora sp. PA3]